MNNELSLFVHELFGEIRVVDRSGQPWFVAKDVATSLGYGNHRQAISSHCKGVQKLDAPTSSGHQPLSIISESDVYRLVMRSKLPSAEAFQDWVVDEVLPQIRKTGRYDHQPMTLVGEIVSTRMSVCG